jgi:hypothetical protein
LYEDRFEELITLSEARELPLDIAYLPILLKNIHPGFSIPMYLIVFGMILLVIGFPLLQDTETQDEKNSKCHPKEYSNDPTRSDSMLWIAIVSAAFTITIDPLI